MLTWLRATDWRRVVRYYQAGVVNIMFGYCLFAALVWIGLQVYVAQIVGHVIGVAFNYFTYSRYAFADHSSSKTKYLLSYVGNYFLGLAGLWLALKVYPSPYVAGFASTVAVSVLNYFVLRKFVFRSQAGA